ncbi:DEAD/DEAH box helicase family protein [Pontiella sulfatireligans]|uniref:Helicase ATP-binding domain-containing protein n=1 Tax=Pontiella sulfatireligans TaxID=2750658 RepID=A0A6C2UE44_9BACT|nr:DEAD/DEAH box helicase family protein [Pontiella sulfatireligans]VGO18133.1 hypothetical protein SCARR_00184 [Pontiella sulfatireligans]
MPSIEYNEADTRAKLIDPALHRRGWTEDFIRREVTAGSIEIISGKARRRGRGKADYVLRYKLRPDAQPVALALIEAKRNTLPAGHGLDQAKGYAACDRLHVRFVFSSNGYQFVEFDRETGVTSDPQPIEQFPSPEDLRKRFEASAGFALDDPAAAPLLQTYHEGEGTRRYYQDAAIRAVLEKVARCEREGKPSRALLSLATGAGKTFIAVNLLKRIADAGLLKRALFLCDRDELRTQGLKAFQNVFGSDAAEVFRKNGENNAQNARVHVATYQTLGVDKDDGDASFLSEFYPENHFTHIVIDECHRSAWGKWSEVLNKNPKAVQVGLTATPRKLAEKLERNAGSTIQYPMAKVVVPEELPLAAESGGKPATTEAMKDATLCADNHKYFGEPVYEYDMAQAIEDGYLAACQIQHGLVSVDETGITKADILARNPKDAITGKPITAAQLDELYRRHQFEDRILLPDRVMAMCQDLFNYLLETGGPEQKTIIFCARDRHADDVATQLNNLYADWCRKTGKERLDCYAFKCTAASSGNDQLPDLRAASRSHFIATTVDLLSTGVDVPCVRNIVFMKYVKSPISFYQMLGRGTRIDIETNKLMFTVYDYTGVTGLFGEEFITKPPREPGDGPFEPPPPPPPPEPTIIVDGFDVHVTDAGRSIVTEVDGKAMPVSVEEYRARLAAKLIEEAHTLSEFRSIWIDPPTRRELIDTLVSAGYSPRVVRMVDDKDDCDLYDVLAELGWGLSPRTRQDRALAFTYKNEEWLGSLPEVAGRTIKAIAGQFRIEGTEALENKYIFGIPEVEQAGGLNALRAAGEPKELLRETKIRMFAA